jgi:hypothetical protein
MNEAALKIEAGKFFKAITGLSEANYLTGVWDNRRNSLCQKPFNEFSEEDKAYLYHTEKLSRKNVELRAVHRKELDRVFKKLININKKLTSDDI